jgi:UDP-N-acetylglucosamine--N-acetylmuramyl-(pentapeptide) pyrophosphoryl-undecaprenol N-acetylglucosamine transferase
MLTVLIAGGGTGGHVFPMVAVGDALRAAEPHARVVYVGTAKGLEAKIVPERGDELELMRILPLRGGGLSGFVAGAARALGSLPEARALVRRLAPSVVLSVGGYAAGPVSLAARLQGVPLTLLEPNSILGLANRLLAPLARRAYVAFPEVERRFRSEVAMFSGVPLRRAFATVPYRPEPGRLRVLVLGGSQGAAPLNDRVPEAIALAARSVPGLSVVHQTGDKRDTRVRERYRGLGLLDGTGAPASVEVRPFIDDVAGALAAADVVIQRSGASSLAELCAIGRPAILVPFPLAADDHQTCNARSLEKEGAAVAIAQADATPLRLAAELERLARDPACRVAMAGAAARRGAPHAAARVAADLLDIARRGS